MKRSLSIMIACAVFLTVGTVGMAQEKKLPKKMTQKDLIEKHRKMPERTTQRDLIEQHRRMPGRSERAEKSRIMSEKRKALQAVIEKCQAAEKKEDKAKLEGQLKTVAAEFYKLKCEQKKTRVEDAEARNKRLREDYEKYTQNSDQEIQKLIDYEKKRLEMTKKMEAQRKKRKEMLELKKAKQGAKAEVKKAIPSDQDQ